MKYQLGPKDYLEKHHIYSLIWNHMQEHNGDRSEYIIVHPATYHKIIMLTNERNDDLICSVVQFDYKSEKPVTTIYGVSFIRSFDIEEDFIIVT